MTATEISPRRTREYALDSEWHAERERLGSLSQLYDPGTLELCARLGLARGWRCADVGAGTGTLAEVLADRVGPGGSVLAVDVNTRFLDPLASASLRVLRSDVTVQPLPADQFDLVHARLLLEHLGQRDRILTEMAAAVRPGGWLLVEDLDWATALVIDPSSEAHDRVVGAITALFTQHGYDPYYGRRLPRRLQAAGLIDIGTRAQSMQVRADSARGVPQWELLVDQLAPGMIAAGLVDADDLARFHALWHDDATVCFAPLMVSCWGRRAA